MKADIINALIGAIKNVLAAAGSISAKLDGKPEFVTQPVYSEKVCVLIGTTGALSSQIVFEYTEESALFLADKMMMGFGSGELGEMEKSAISEFSNMTMGTFATSVTSMDMIIDITIPTLFVGDNMSLSSGVRGIKFKISSEDDTFKMSITVMLKD